MTPLGLRLYSAGLLALAVPVIIAYARPERLGATVRLCLRSLLGLLALGSVLGFFGFGEFSSLYLDRRLGPSSSKESPWETDRSWVRGKNFHFHEVYHYYLGSKYLHELQYAGLYNCILLADSELFKYARPFTVRNLSNILEFIPPRLAKEDCRKHHRPRFTPVRWEHFKADIVFLQHISPSEWWTSGMMDAGFNPPPTWAVVGGTLSNLIPLTARTYSWLPAFDVLFLAGGLCLLGWAFGWLGPFSFLIIYGTSYSSSYMWNGGSYLRYLWLFELMAALAFLKKERYGLAGGFFGVSVAMRVFPGAFALGAALPLLHQALRTKEARLPLKRFLAGLALALGALLLASLALYGWATWETFFQRISIHENVYFVRHLGFKKLAVFDASWVPSQNFHGVEGVDRFMAWNARLAESWAARRWFCLPLLLGITAMALRAGRTLRPGESAMLIGLSTMFLYQIPANYYYVVWALLPAVLLHGKPGRRDLALAAAFFIFLIFESLAPALWRDDIVQTHRICAALLAFLVVWIGVRTS